jgi:transcriptional regulator with PAS, ATPase and Fis domain
MRSIKKDLNAIDEMYTKHAIISKLPTRVTELIKYQKLGRIDDYVFASKKTKTILEDVLNIAGYDCNLVIQGETGAGKEKILGLIHKNSNRKMNPCIKINCATIQENLAESDFFGYESGAFTGANAGGKQGYFELANNGILFLDEVGELPLNLQAKLLRVLQENQFYRLGGQKQITVNVRVVCASNVSLRELVKLGKFREDLYYRLNIYEIHVPPLRERIEDISCLAESFMSKYNERYVQNKKLSEDAIKNLESYSWPGNVRELDNTIHRAVINFKENLINSECIRNAINSNLYGQDDSENDLAEAEKHSCSLLKLDEMLEKHEKAIIEEALNKEQTTRKAAETLGISQSQFMRKKKKYDL